MLTSFPTNSLQTAALDSSLALSGVVDTQRELVVGSAKAGFSGLLSSLDQANAYNAAMTALEETVASLDEATKEVEKKPFTLDKGTLSGEVKDDVKAGLAGQATPLVQQANNAVSTAATAEAATAANTAERTAATAVSAAASKAADAAKALKQGDAANGTSLANQAVDAAQAALTQAQSALSTLQGQKDPPADRVSAAQKVVVAAQETLTAAKAVAQLGNSPIAAIAAEKPVVYDLKNGYTLSTWGDTGIWTLVGSDGKGILVRPDGKVDSLDGSGDGWEFQTTSTFVLDDDTKITVTPGSGGMEVLAVRGDYQVKVEDLKKGTQPDVTGPKRGGRKADRDQNDGHIFRIVSGDATKWTLGGQALGDTPGKREVVATVSVTNELKLDPSDVPIPDDLRAFLEANNIPLSDLDYDGDGKLNDSELSQLSAALSDQVISLQSAFEKALLNTMGALDAMVQLNLMLDQIRRQGDRKQGEREQIRGQEREEFLAIQRQLEAARRNLAGQELAQTGAPVPQPSSEAGPQSVSVPNPTVLLDRIGQFLRDNSGQTSRTSVNVEEPAPRLPSEQSTPMFSSGAPQTPFPQPTQQQPASEVDPVSQALRRAGRLLSGFNPDSLSLPQPAAPERQVPSEPTAQPPVLNGEVPIAPESVQPTGELAPPPPPAVPGSVNLPSTPIDGLVPENSELGGQSPQIPTGGQNVPNQPFGSEPPTGEPTPPQPPAVPGAVNPSPTPIGGRERENSDRGTQNPQILTSGQNVSNQPFGSEPPTGEPTPPPQPPAVPGAVNPSPTPIGGRERENSDRGTQNPQILTSGQNVSNQPFVSEPPTGEPTPPRPPAAPGAVNPPSTPFDGRAPENSDLGVRDPQILPTRQDGQNVPNQPPTPPVVPQTFAPVPTDRSNVPSPDDGAFRPEVPPAQTAPVSSPFPASPEPSGPLTDPATGTGSAPTTVLPPPTPLPGQGASVLFGDNGSPTEPARVLSEVRQRLNGLIRQQGEQFSRASTLFAQAQSTVQRFVQIVAEDDLLQGIVFSDNLSDDEQSKFAGKMLELRREWGIEWGSSSDSDGARTPAENVQLVSRMVQSGLMI